MHTSISISLSQIELNRKRETELAQLRKDFEAQTEEHDRSVAEMRKKQTQAIGELEEQMQTLQKGKSKAEKDRQALTSEVADISGQLEDTQKAKVISVHHTDINNCCLGFALFLACLFICLMFSFVISHF